MYDPLGGTSRMRNSSSVARIRTFLSCLCEQPFWGVSLAAVWKQNGGPDGPSRSD